MRVHGSTDPERVQTSPERRIKELCVHHSSLLDSGQHAITNKFLKRKQRGDEEIAEYAEDLKDSLYQAWPGMPRDKLEDILIEYFTAGLNNQETSARIRIEKPKTITKAVDIAEIYEEMIRKNTSLISKTEYQTTPTYTQFDNTIMSTPLVFSTQIGERLIQMANQNTLNTPASTRIKPRNVMFGSLNVTRKESSQRTLLLNNKPINTSASMSVISEDTARTVVAKISPYDKTQIIAMTADGKEVKDVIGFAEVEVTLGSQKLTNARMLFFKNLTNPCLIGRDILSAHPETKDHFEAIIGKMEDKPQIPNKLPIKPCSHQHKDRSSDDDYD